MSTKNFKEFSELDDKDKKKFLYPYPDLFLENENEMAYLVKFLASVAKGDGKELKEGSKNKTLEDVEKAMLDNVSGVTIYSPKMANAQSSSLTLNLKPRKADIGLVTESVGEGRLFYSYCGNAAMINYGKLMTTSFIYKDLGSVCLYSLAIEHFELFERVMKNSGFSENFATLFVEKINSIQDLYKNAEVDSNIKQIYFPVDNKYHILGIINSSKLRFELSQYIKERKKELEDEKIYFNVKEIAYGGTKPLNAGEVLGFLSGKPQTLKAFLPNAIINNKKNDYLLEKVTKSGNIFDAIKPKRIYYSSKISKDKFNYIHSFEKYLNMPVNSVSKNKIDKVCFSLLKEMLFDVEKFVNEVFLSVDKNDEVFEKMNDSMKKFIAPHLFTGSITAGDYRELQNLFMQSVRKNLSLKKDNETYVLEDRITESFDKVSRKLMEDF